MPACIYAILCAKVSITTSCSREKERMGTAYCSTANYQGEPHVFKTKIRTERRCFLAIFQSVPSFFLRYKTNITQQQQRDGFLL